MAHEAKDSAGAGPAFPVGAGGKGGLMFAIEGQAGPVREKKSEDGKQVLSHSIDVSYWGGSEFCKLADATQAPKLKGGEWVRMEAPVKSFKDNKYAGGWIITHINGKAVA